MPTNAEARLRLVDTSVAVALSVADHEGHEATAAALTGRTLGLAGHAAFETFSVLTRLPGAARRPAGVVAGLLEANFPETRFLSAGQAAALLARLADAEILGGAVYDALVAAVAAEHDAVLVTRDRRALGIYRAVGADVEYLNGGRRPSVWVL